MSRRYVFITGTDTGVGKTIVTAALAVRLGQRGTRMHIRKPVQTGLVGEDDPRRSELESHYTDVVTRGDAEIAGTLAGVDWSTGVSLTLPMAPAAAAARSGELLPTPLEHATAIVDLARNPPASDRERSTAVLIEGAGGLLVDFGQGRTLADVAATVADLDSEARIDIVIVARAELGTLNHTALTCEALRNRGLPVSGIVLGSWPHEPGPVALDNRRRLGEMAPVLGALPADCGHLSPSDFRAHAAHWTSVD